MSNPICTLDGCERPSRNKGGGALCKMHYHRQYRHGDAAKTAAGLSTNGDVGRYRQRMAHGHPVAGPSGKAYVHRIVLFDDIGPGWHSCDWCGRPITWDLPSTDPNGLQVDHLNGRRDDNRIENLVPSCPDCNAGRGAAARHQALVAAGFWSVNDTIANTGRGRKHRVDPAA